MFVFEAVDDGVLALMDIATKKELPFDEYLVVAGRMKSSRQLTGIGGRIKRDGKRRLLVIPLTKFLSTHTPSVQLMDVGEVAANFLQSIRACFPTLVKKNPMTSAVDNSDSDSDQEDAYKKQKHAKDAQPAFDCKVAKAHRLAAEAKMSMSLIKVKFLRTLEDLFDAFQISDPANVRTSLRNDPSVPNDCQLLCLDCPPFRNIENVPYKAVPHVSSLTFASPDPFNIGVLYSEVITSNKKKQFLHIPIPRSLSHSAPGVQGQSETQYTFQDATVLSFDAKRESTAHGGGKTCEELVKNIRMRHASGTFCTLVLPSKTWEEVADEHKSFLPQVDELQGELRLRRLVGNVPCGVPIKFLLAS